MIALSRLSQFRPLRGIDLDLESGKLHPLSVLLAGPGHLTQAFLAAIRQSVHVMSDQDQHLNPKTRVDRLGRLHHSNEMKHTAK